MALPSTIYRATLQLSDIDKGVYETISLTVAQHPSETAERMVARILAFALWYEPELVFTKGLCAPEEPDLWVKSPDDRTKLWIEVGLPESDRINKAARHAEQVKLLASGKALNMWEQNHLPLLGKHKNLTVVTIDHGYLVSLANTLKRVINWEITITEGMLYLNCGGTAYETTLAVKMGTV